MFSSLGLRNPYLNMENTMEDFTIDQKKIELERQTFQQSQRDILNSMRPASNASGVASLAQSLVRQGQRSEQQLAATISKQESENRILALKQRESIERLSREGKRIPMDFRAQQMGARMSMAQEQYAADKELELQYYSSLMGQASASISSNMSTFNTMLGAMGG